MYNVSIYKIILILYYVVVGDSRAQQESCLLKYFHRKHQMFLFVSIF